MENKTNVNQLLKKNNRMLMLEIMNKNPDWLNTEKDLQKIQNLAEPLFFQRPPYPSVKNDWSTFKRSDFIFLLSLGYDTKDITEIYRVGSQTLNQWKKDQRLHGTPKEEVLERYSDEVVKARKQKKLSDYGIQT